MRRSGVEALSSGTADELKIIERLVQALEYVSTSPMPPPGPPASDGGAGARVDGHLGDAIIAGVAWSIGATIVTRNPRDFEGQGVPVLAYGQTAA